MCISKYIYMYTYWYRYVRICVAGCLLLWLVSCKVNTFTRLCARLQGCGTGLSQRWWAVKFKYSTRVCVTLTIASARVIIILSYFHSKIGSAEANKLSHSRTLVNATRSSWKPPFNTSIFSRSCGPRCFAAGSPQTRPSFHMQPQLGFWTRRSWTGLMEKNHPDIKTTALKKHGGNQRIEWLLCSSIANHIQIQITTTSSHEEWCCLSDISAHLFLYFPDISWNESVLQSTTPT